MIRSANQPLSQRSRRGAKPREPVAEGGGELKTNKTSLSSRRSFFGNGFSNIKNVAAGAELSEVRRREASPPLPNRWQSFTLVTVFCFFVFFGGLGKRKEVGGGWGLLRRVGWRSREQGLMSGAGQNPEERQLKGHHQPGGGAQAGRSATVRIVLLAASEETHS